MEEESFLGGKPTARPGLQELYKAREKESLKWLVSPLVDLKGKEFKSFHVRHEASMLELFFDLFFVANLATFTAYHDITTTADVLAYIGFFLILWSTWFQITIFDVRFAADSVFERTCKLCQFISFTIFSAAGANFNPGTYKSAKYYRIYQAMAIILGFSRLLLALQYAVMASFVCRKYKKLVLPFSLIIITFLISGIGLSLTLLAFNKKSVSSVHIVWWILLPSESIIIVLISSIWRMLSFKETHMNERLSLLTMIVIGEGVIGVTKTIGYLWPTEGSPSLGNVISLISIVVMLLLMWQIYFDNHPHGDYGTIKQQWWALSHFFLHLGIVGTVEGSNRMAVTYFATQIRTDIFYQIDNLCNPITNVTRRVFVDSLNSTLQYLKLDKYDPRSYDEVHYYLNQSLYPQLAPAPCNLSAPDSQAVNIEYYLQKGTFKRFSIEAAPRTDGYFRTFKTTFIYLWCSVGLTMFMLLLFLWIVRRKKHDILEVIRMSVRMIITVVSGFIACLSLSEEAFLGFITSPWVVFTICALMGLTLLLDRICRFLGVRSFRRKYAIPPPSHDHSHGQDHEHGHISPHHNKHSSMAFGIARPVSMASGTYPGQDYEMIPSPKSQKQSSRPDSYMQQDDTPARYFTAGIQGPDQGFSVIPPSAPSPGKSPPSYPSQFTH